MTNCGSGVLSILTLGCLMQSINIKNGCNVNFPGSQYEYTVQAIKKVKSVNVQNNTYVCGHIRIKAN